MATYVRGKFRVYRVVPRKIWIGRDSGVNGITAFRDEKFLFDGWTVKSPRTGTFDSFDSYETRAAIERGFLILDPNAPIGNIGIKDEGTSIGVYETLDFIGPGVHATPDTSDEADITVTTGVRVKDEGVDLGLFEGLNFKGSGVVATPSGTDADVTISGSIGNRAIAGENLSVGDLIYLDSSGNALRALSTFAANKWRVVGVAINNALLGGTVTFAKHGDIIPMQFGAPPGAGSNGSYVFLDNTAGQASIIPPLGGGEVRFLVGLLKGANGITTTPDTLFFPEYISRRPL